MRGSGASRLRRRVYEWITSVNAFDAADRPDSTVALFDEATEKLIGHISEAEFAVVRDALEVDGQDDDYWIDDEEIAGIVPRTGATPHLVALLRRVVYDRTDGVSVRFERAASRTEP